MKGRESILNAAEAVGGYDPYHDGKNQRSENEQSPVALAQESGTPGEA